MPANQKVLPRDPRPQDDAEWTDARSPVSEPESDGADLTVTATRAIDRAASQAGLPALPAMSAAGSDGNPLSAPAELSFRFELSSPFVANNIANDVSTLGLRSGTRHDHTSSTSHVTSRGEPSASSLESRARASPQAATLDPSATAPTPKTTPSRRIPIKLRNVYVGALPLAFTDADLAALLSEFGKVKSCRMFNTGARVAEIGRAYGFGLFEEATSAERAVAELDGKPLGNGRIQCQLSRNGVVKKPKGGRKFEDWQPAPPNPEPLPAVESASASLQGFPCAVDARLSASLALPTGLPTTSLGVHSNHSNNMFAPPLHSPMSFAAFQALAPAPFPSGLPNQPPVAASPGFTMAPAPVPVATPTGVVWMRPV